MDPYDIRLNEIMKAITEAITEATCRLSQLRQRLEVEKNPEQREAYESSIQELRGEVDDMHERFSELYNRKHGISN